jgi:transposase
VLAGKSDSYVDEVLAPSFRLGEIVVLDDLGSHTGKAARKVIEQAGGELCFLPTSSPDLNPVKQVFAVARQVPLDRVSELHPQCRI